LRDRLPVDGIPPFFVSQKSVVKVRTTAMDICDGNFWLSFIEMAPSDTTVGSRPNGKAMQAIAGGLGPNGVMMVIGAVGPLTINSLDLLMKSAAVRGWYSGIARDSEDTLAFSKMQNVTSMNEIYPLAKAQEAYDRMMSGKARFRVVLDMGA
jgi:D-arabinose 1-dehydrogenase-like Zn-dependent alcohol dehydrogenase